MCNNNFNIIRNLMIKDNSLNEAITEFETTYKRDITTEEENGIISEVLTDCKERMKELSCSLSEAYNDMMY